MNSYGTALVIGVLNTLKVAVIGIVLATILGTLIGIGRLSKNWLLSKITAFYVETLRDIPLLLQLLFWYTILQGLPAPRQALHIGQFCLPHQPRHEGPPAGVAARPHLDPARLHRRRHRHRLMEPPSPQTTGGNRRPPRRLARRRGPADRPAR